MVCFVPSVKFGLSRVAVTKFQDLSVSIKLLIALAFIALATGIGAFYSSSEMGRIGSVYVKLLDNEAMAKLWSARNGRTINQYGRLLYATLEDTDEAHAAQQAAQMLKVKAQVLEREKLLRELVPAQDSEITATYKVFQSAFSTCEPFAHEAGKVTTPDAIHKLASVIQQKCDPLIDAAADASVALTDAIIKSEKMRKDELAADTTNANRASLIVSFGGIVLGGAFLIWIGRAGIAGPLGLLEGAMKALANGKLEVAIPGDKRGDEVGSMARTVLVFKENAIRVKALEADTAAQRAQAERDRQAAEREQAAMKEQAERDRIKALHKMADDFEMAVMGLVKGVAAQATEMQATAQNMSHGAEQASSLATSVASAAEEATTNVETVATAAEELSSSISEITRQVADAARVATDAASESERTNTMVRTLAESAEKIGDVVKLINDIASQTNLLALNATIEAARAGEAGKGFAVVANEVKNLATQTATATSEIARQINLVQDETRNTVNAIQIINTSIANVRQITSAIAAAVEEQGAATQDIARNVTQAATGTREVSGNIQTINANAANIGSAASEVLASSSDLSRTAETLSAEMGSFLNKVRQG
jgi:methyl-accepting chemotaxis protein